MVKRIRSNYLKLALPLTVVLLLSSSLLFWITGFGILYAFKAPVELSSLTEENLKDAYVSVKVDQLGATYSYKGYTDENEEKVVVERYCVYVIGNKFLPVRVVGDDLTLMSDYDNAKEMIDSGQLGSMKEVHIGTLTGTITDSLDNNVYDMLCSWIKDDYLADKNSDDAIKQSILSQFNISEDPSDGKEDTTDYSAIYKETIIPLQLEVGYYGGMPKLKVILISIAAFILLAAGLALIITLVLGLWEKPLRRYIKLHGKKALSEDYESGADFTKYLRVGNSYIWWFKGISTFITELSGVIWAYPRSRRLEGGKLTWYLVLRTNGEDEYAVHIGDTSTVQAAIDAIKAKGHPLVTGYDKEKQKLYERDIPTFIARAKNGTL